jgi:uncharacterized coiled-coil protein SlyX
MRKTMKKKVCILIFAFIGALAMNTAQAQTYDPLGVQRINDLIANNNVYATPDAPETWEFAVWNDEIPKQIIELNFYHQNLRGAASFAKLTTLQMLNCSGTSWYPGPVLNKLDLTNCTQLQTLYCYYNTLTELNLTNCMQLKWLGCDHNQLTKLDLTTCTQLKNLYCHDNQLTELDLTNCTQLQDLDCFNNQLTELDLINCTQLQFLLRCMNNRLTKLDLTGLDKLYDFYGYNQNVSLTLHKNEEDTYSHSIVLNDPAFGNPTISYANGVLESADSTVASTSFVVQTGKLGFKLSGTMNFTYFMVGIDTPDKAPLKVYPNPANDLLFIECEELSAIKIYDMMGKEVLSQQGTGKTTININNLPAGTYIVHVLSERKVIGNIKIVK